MEIFFDNEKLEQSCNSHSKLVRQHGKIMADRIRRRLDDLDAVSNLEEMRNLPGRCHELIGNRKGQLSLDLVHPQRLIFVPRDNPPPRKADGGLDWSQVKAILILGIDDTHD